MLKLFKETNTRLYNVQIKLIKTCLSFKSSQEKKSKFCLFNPKLKNWVILLLSSSLIDITHTKFVLSIRCISTLYNKI